MLSKLTEIVMAVKFLQVFSRLLAHIFSFVIARELS